MPTLNNNETFGMTVEYCFAELNNDVTSIDINRIDLSIKNRILADPNFQTFINNNPNLNTLQYCGQKGSPVDFKDSANQTYSFKTNTTSDKICPQKIGQPSKKRFYELVYQPLKRNLQTENQNQLNRLHQLLSNLLPHEMIDIIGTYLIKPIPVMSNPPKDQEIKNFILEHPIPLVNLYASNLFCCDYLVYVTLEKNNTFTFNLYSKENLIFILDENTNYKFTNNLTKKKSTTLQIKKNGNEISIGEFQLHSNRNNVKFRFYWKNLIHFRNSG